MSQTHDYDTELLDAAIRRLRQSKPYSALASIPAYSIAARLANNQIISARSVTINSVFHASAAARLLINANEQSFILSSAKKILLLVDNRLFTFALDEDIFLLRHNNVSCAIQIIDQGKTILLKEIIPETRPKYISLTTKNEYNVTISGKGRTNSHFERDIEFRLSTQNSSICIPESQFMPIGHLLATLHDDYKYFTLEHITIKTCATLSQHFPVSGRDLQLLYRCATPELPLTVENALGESHTTSLSTLLPDAYRTTNTRFPPPKSMARLKVVNDYVHYKEEISILINEQSLKRLTHSVQRLAGLLLADGRFLIRDNAALKNLVAPSCAETQLFHALRFESTEKPKALFIALNPDEDDPRFAMPCGLCRDVGAGLWGEDFPLLIVHPDGRVWQADTTGFALKSPPTPALLNRHAGSPHTTNLAQYWCERREDDIAVLTAARCADGQFLIDWARPGDSQPGFLGATLTRAGLSAAEAWIILDPTVYQSIPPLLAKLRRQLGENCSVHVAWSDTFTWQDWPLHCPQDITMPS